MRSLVFLLLFAPLAAADVRVVSSTGPYTTIQAAVNAANEGDLVLVRTGGYGSFTIQAKSLTVVADTGATASIQGGVSVLGLAAGQAVSLIGLDVLSDFSWPATRTLLAQGNQGSVRCEQCNFWQEVSDRDSVRVESSSDVSFVGCEMTAADFSDNGGAGARVHESTVTFFDCILRGGSGIDAVGSLFDGGWGGPGMYATSSTIFSSGSSFHGGSGGSGQGLWIIIPDPGYGGAGAALEAGSSMHYIQTTFVGGPNGAPLGGAAPGMSGVSFTLVPGTKRTMTGANPVRELTPLSFSFQGAPAENVYLLVGLETGVQWDPAHEANFLLASPFRTLPVGTTNGSGNLTISLPLSDLGSGVQSEMFYLQPLFVGPGGAQQLGTPISLAALDQQF